MATVTFDHMYKRYGDDVIAVNDLNLEIKDGEFLVLVGPSGCGKTTALRCVAGLEDISDGRLLIGDRVVNNVAPKDRDIAMVFQSYALYPHMTRVRQPGVRPQAAQAEEGRDRPAREGGRRHPRPRALPGAQAEGPLRRPAPARRPRPRHRARALGLPDGRAALATSTPSCACRPAPRSPVSTSDSGPQPSTSPTTRSRP